MKTKLYTTIVNFYHYPFTASIVLPLVIATITFTATPVKSYCQANTFDKNISNNDKQEIKQKQSALQTLRQSSNVIWFEKNEGQFPDKKIQYGFRTAFGIIAVFENKLRMVARQSINQKTSNCQVVDITFPGCQPRWAIKPGSESSVKGTYNTSSGSITPNIYNEIILREVYPGIDLRLYSGEKGSLEFDWLVNKAASYQNIKMKFDGQDGLKVDKKGNLLIDLRYEDMSIMMPETYQVINGIKKLLPAKMQLSSDKKSIFYHVSGDIVLNEPLVIDPVMSWSTFMHNNTKTFDEYLYTVAANADDEIYAAGLTNEAISSAYLSSVAPGFSGRYIREVNDDGAPQTAILYKLNSSGTAITAWTYTGVNINIPVAMAIFPNKNVLVVYQNDLIQIFSPNLSTRNYNGVINAAVAANVYTYQSVSIADDSTFYLGGIAGSRLPSSIIHPDAPDTSFSITEGLVLKIVIANTVPVASWGTYIGGDSRERFTAIALTPDKARLTFAVYTDANSTGGYPSLVHAVDNTMSGSELLIGVLALPNPTSFEMFSFLGGEMNEGSYTSISSAALVAADNDYFFVAGNTSSTVLPGAIGTAQTTHGINSRYCDQFVSRIPIGGSTGTGFKTSFNGGNDVDIVGGLVIDTRTSDVLLFGTTVSSDFPVYSPNPYTPYYQNVHGSFANGTRDITYTIFTNDLSQRKYSTYIGGSFDDYLGSTGKLEGTGHFQYSNSSGLTYIGTTIHSDQSSLPSQWMSGIPGFDKAVPAATTGKDSHYIFAINPNTSDYGDAPANYDGSNPASSAVSFSDIRMGATVDAEPKANNSDLANGDDLQNYGSADDEDGVVTAQSMYAFTTTYSVTVSVLNKTGGTIQLCGWIDTNGNGVFDTNEYASFNVPARSNEQSVVLNFTNLPPFVPISGKTYMRLRLTNVPMTAASARGALGKGEVEDYIVPQAVILPIKIEGFTATAQNEMALLQWDVSNEDGITMYEAEHSKDNSDFTSIGSVLQSNKGAYDLLDPAPENGNNYYRIKMVGIDGSTLYSASKKVAFIKSKNISIHPNPAKDIINIHFGTIPKQSVTITVMSADGREIAKKIIPVVNEKEVIDAGNFAKGYYFVNIKTGNETVIKAIQVTH